MLGFSSMTRLCSFFTICFETVSYPTKETLIDSFLLRWSIVPYDADMADEKVDSMLIGFAVNGMETETYGQFEQLSVSDWQIVSNDSLPLIYSANVSAVSEPIEEQVLTLVFVLDWAA